MNLRITVAGLVLVACANAPAFGQQGFTGGGTAPSLGFSYAVPSTPGEDGDAILGFIVVRRVPAGSNAERAGLVVGDTIVAVNGKDSRERPLFTERAPGTRYVLRVRREGEEMEIEYTVPAPATGSE